MATTFKKERLGKQDILWDQDGTGSTTQVSTSSGGLREVAKVNATHVPVTTSVRAKNYADGSNVGSAGDNYVDDVLKQLLDDVEDLGQPDASTLENDSGTLQVKDSGITNAKLAPASGTAAVSGSGGAGINVIEAASIGETELADDCIDSDKIANDAVDSADYIADDTVSLEHLDTGLIPSGMTCAVAVATGIHTWTGAATDTNTVTIANVLATDTVQATIHSNNSADQIEAVYTGSGNITIVLIANGTLNVTKINYTVFRAMS